MEISIFSRDEKKPDDMCHEYQVKYLEYAYKVKFYLGDVCNIGSIRSTMVDVDYIFHAATFKQVSPCEFFPLEAVCTNVIGTDNVLTDAIDVGIKCIVCLSTDKAAYPINAMGITKALGERGAVAKSRTADLKKRKFAVFVMATLYVFEVLLFFFESLRSKLEIRLRLPSRA